MNINSKITNFGSQLSRAQKSLLELARSEGLDEFVALQSLSRGKVEYFTLHGRRTFSSDRPKDNIFFVVEDRGGFARGNAIPYEFHYCWDLLPPEELSAANVDELIDVSILVVNFVLPDEPAFKAGWAKAVKLPYYLIRDDFLDKSVLIVSDAVEEAKTAGYARAVPLPYDRYLPDSEFNQPRLTGDLNHIPPAMYAAYGKAIESPDEVYLRFHSTCCFTICIPNSLEVYINSQNEEATSAGYANAVPLPISISNIYIEDLQMLDTDYAASLVDFPRFA